VGGRAKGYETWLKAQEERVAAEVKAKDDEQGKAPGRKKKNGGVDN